MNKFIMHNKEEMQSGLGRVQWAEGLILQLPKTHEGRASWLLNYGVKEEAVARRKKKNIDFIDVTASARTIDGYQH